MADAPVVHIGENSPEHVAYILYSTIRKLEGQKGGRKEILDLYAECLNTVKNPQLRAMSQVDSGISGRLLQTSWTADITVEGGP